MGPPTGLAEAHRDQLLDHDLRQGLVDGKVQGALGHRVALELIGERPEYRAAERQVAEVILEGRKAGDDLALDAEGGTR